MTDAGLDNRPNPPGRRLRAPKSKNARVALTLLGVAAAVAIVGGWVLPNVAGPIFLQVRALAAPRVAAAGPAISIDGGDSVQASAIDIAVEVSNHYPMAVVVGTGMVAFKAAIYRHDSTGHVTRIWQTSFNDPTLEEGSDSPAGGGSASGAAVVASGTTRHSITGLTSPFTLVDAAGQPLAAGVYYLQVWAYGIGSGPVPFTIDNGTDALGPPSDLQAPPDPTPAF